MPRTRQVWHVFAKDVRRQRWLLLLFTVQAFVAMLGLTVQNLGPSSKTYAAALLYVTLPITAVILVAMSVQDDAPTIARAWWASLALDREAVFGAKLLFALGLIPLVVILAAGALQWSFGVRGLDLLLLSFRGSQSIVLMVSIALPLAALQQDLRSFLLAAVASAVAAMLIISVVSSPTGVAITLGASQSSWFTHRIVTIMSTMLLLMLAWHAYRTRSRTWKAWGALVPLVAFTVIGKATMPNGNMWGKSERLEAVRLRASLYQTAAQFSSQQTLRWSMRLEGLPPELRGSVYLPVTRFEGPNACGKVIAFGEPIAELRSPPLPMPGSPVRWRGSSPSAASAADSVWTRDVAINSRVPSDCTPVARAELHVHEPRFLASIALAAGESFTKRGYRVSVQNTERQDVWSGRFANSLVLASLKQVSSIPSQTASSSPNRKLSYVLLHPDRREAIQLHADLPSGYGELGSVSTAEIHLLLRDSVPMSDGLATDTSQSIWQQLEFADEAEFEAWLRGAELAVFEWKLVGSIQAEIVESVERGRSVTPVVERVK